LIVEPSKEISQAYMEKSLKSLKSSKVLFKIKKAKKERINKQYYVDSKVLEREVKDLIRDAEDFVTLIFNFIETLKQDDIDCYRKKAIKILS
jgi:uncharacterized protein (UPF0332 family)